MAEDISSESGPLSDPTPHPVTLRRDQWTPLFRCVRTEAMYNLPDELAVECSRISKIAHQHLGQYYAATPDNLRVTVPLTRRQWNVALEAMQEWSEDAGVAEATVTSIRSEVLRQLGGST